MPSSVVTILATFCSNYLNVQVSFLSHEYFPHLTGCCLFRAFTTDVFSPVQLQCLIFSIFPWLCSHHDTKCSSMGLRLTSLGFGRKISSCCCSLAAFSQAASAPLKPPSYPGDWETPDLIKRSVLMFHDGGEVM